MRILAQEFDAIAAEIERMAPGARTTNHVASVPVSDSDVQAEVAAIRREFDAIAAEVLVARLQQRQRAASRHSEPTAKATPTAPVVRAPVLTAAERELVARAAAGDAALRALQPRSLAAATRCVQVLPPSSPVEELLLVRSAADVAVSGTGTRAALTHSRIVQPCVGAGLPFMRELAAFVQRAQHSLRVRTLDLDSNRLDGAALDALADLLPMWPGLRRLRLVNQSQRAPRDAIDRLYNALLEHAGVERVSMSELSVGQQTQLDRHLSDNAKRNQRMAGTCALRVLTRVSASDVQPTNACSSVVARKSNSSKALKRARKRQNRRQQSMRRPKCIPTRRCSESTSSRKRCARPRRAPRAQRRGWPASKSKTTRCASGWRACRTRWPWKSTPRQSCSSA